MQIFSESTIHHPIARVYPAYRDRLPEIAAYMPDIREIRVMEREELPGGLRLLNLWIPSRQPPRAVAGFIKPEWLQWEDHAVWSDAETAVDWRIALPGLPDRVRCSGRNAFSEAGPGQTRVRLTGDLRIDAERFPGVPTLLARRAAPAIERFIVDLITPNLSRVNQSLEAWLDAQG